MRLLDSFFVNHTFIRIKMSRCAVMVFHQNADQIYSWDWVDKCADSILGQTFGDFDIYEVNYGRESFSIFEGKSLSCGDAAKEVDVGDVVDDVAKYRSGKHELRKKIGHFYYHKVMGNHAEAINFLLDCIRGNKTDYRAIFMTHVDDFYSPKRFERQLELI